MMKKKEKSATEEVECVVVIPDEKAGVVRKRLKMKIDVQPDSRTLYNVLGLRLQT